MAQQYNPNRTADPVAQAIGLMTATNSVVEANHNVRRHEAQVDAMLKCKMGEECYEPPAPPDELMNVISNSIIADVDALAQITKKQNIPQVEPLPPRPFPWVPVLLWLLATLLMVGLTVLIMIMLLQPVEPAPGPRDTNVILVPTNPDQIERSTP